MKTAFVAACAAAVIGMQAAPVTALPTFVNGIAVPGSTLDATGVPGANQGRVGFFSDIYYDSINAQWWGLSDRGPGGGLIDYDTRVQRFALDVNPVTGAISNFQVVQTVKFTDAAGNPFNGLAPAPVNTLGRAFDPEGFVVTKSGNFLVSDEYGPSLYEFNRNGTLLRTFTTPANIVPRDALGNSNFAGDAGNTLGKRTNRGFEGLAISPDGRFAFAMLQSPMLEEGGTSGNGRYARIVKFDIATGQAVAQYAYLLDRSGQGQGISALVAINENEFLVLERNNRGVGIGATLATADKNVYRINLAGATDVTNITLPDAGTTLPSGVVAVSKSAKIIDLDANTLAALGNKSPEKWEGLAIGPQLAGGGYLMLAGTDNDYSVTQSGQGQQFDVYFRMLDADPYATSIQCPLDQTTGCFFTANNAPAALTADYVLLPGVLHAYAASAADLPGLVLPVAISLPGTGVLLAIGLAAGLFTRTRKPHQTKHSIL